LTIQAVAVYKPVSANLLEGGSMPDTLTKADLITVIHTENGYTLKQSADIVETLLEIMKRTLASGEDILVSGFGKFEVKDKRERKGRNPATGDDMILPARRMISFKCAEKLRDRINSR